MYKLSSHKIKFQYRFFIFLVRISLKGRFLILMK